MQYLKKINLNISLAAFFIFIVLNLPSIKLLYSSMIINLVALAGLWGVIVYRFVYKKEPNYLLRSERKTFFILISTLFALFFIYMFLGKYGQHNLQILFQFGSVYFSSIAMLFFGHKETNAYLKIQISWAVFLTTAYMFFGLSYDRALGQHYLTLGVPIAVGLVALAGLLIAKPTMKKVLLYIPIIIYLVIGLSSLLGRSPLLFSIIVIVCFWLLTLLYENSGKQIFYKLGYMIATLSIGLVIFLNFVSYGWMKRFKELFDGKEDSRFKYYDKTIDLILSNPLGYGTNAHDVLLGRYPHNIFLEVFLSVGIVGFILFIWIIWMMVKEIRYTIKLKNYMLSISMVTFYYFMTWNVSFNLQSSYIFFGAIALTIASSSSYRKENHFKNTNKNIIIVDRIINKFKKGFGG